MSECTCGANWTDEFCPHHGRNAGKCRRCDDKNREIAELKRKLKAKVGR